jgi:hypothetical protein
MLAICDQYEEYLSCRWWRSGVDLRELPGAMVCEQAHVLLPGWGVAPQMATSSGKRAGVHSEAYRSRAVPADDVQAVLTGLGRMTIERILSPVPDVSPESGGQA